MNLVFSMKTKVLMIIFILLLPNFISLLAYKSVAFDREYSTEQQDVIDYLRSKGALKGEFTEREQSHLADVREVMKSVDVFFWVIFLFLILSGFYLYKKRQLGRALVWGGVLAIAAIVLLSMFAMLNFNVLFNQFHRLFFEPGSWVFSAESRIIQLFPLEFFVGIVKEIVLLALFLGIIFIVVGIYFRQNESGGKRA